MILEFYKYEGTGNDFIIIDDRKNIFNIEDYRLISSLCERRMGIGADGLILLREHIDLDFEMIYFNSDGYQSSMCGNGGRCIVDFAKLLGIIDTTAVFMAIDGKHKAQISEDQVSIQMKDVANIVSVDDDLLLDTGSPHYIKMVDSFDSFDVDIEGKKIRNSDRFKKEGINVNFVLGSDSLEIRTYERGVEAETLSCGTGVVATAIAMHYTGHTKGSCIDIKTMGGVLSIDFEELKGSYKNIWLRGSVSLVYTGTFTC